MRITFDPDKDKANRARPGVSLAMAAELDWDASLVWIDDRFRYDELRVIALAPARATLYYVAFVERRGNAQDHQPASRHTSRAKALCRKHLNASQW